MFALAPTLACAPAAIAFAKLARCPSWLHIQDFELDAALGTGQLDRGMLGSRGRRAVERALLRRFDRVSTISGRMLERLRAKLGRSERTVLFPNWAGPDQLRAPAGPSAYRREFGCGDGDILVLYSGSIGEKQGLEMLLDAAALLADRPRFRFVICGEGPGRERSPRATRGCRTSPGSRSSRRSAWASCSQPPTCTRCPSARESRTW